MTSLSKLSMPRKLPRFSSTPMTSRRRAPILIFLPRGDSLSEQIGRHVVADHADRTPAFRFGRGQKPPHGDVESAGDQELLGRANDLHPAGAAVLDTKPTASTPTSGATALAMSHLLFDLPDLLARDRRAVCCHSPNPRRCGSTQLCLLTKSTSAPRIEMLS